MTTQARFPIRIAAAMALAGAGMSTPLAAQPEPSPIVVAAAPTPAALEAMYAQRDHASALTMSGDFRAARDQWARVARMQRDLGEVPIEALRMRAEMALALGAEVEAARVLRRLGAEAEAGGNPEVSVQAYRNAAALFRSAKLVKESHDCMAEANRLLSSLEPAQRADPASRIARG
jgi:hypothetical protein